MVVPQEAKDFLHMRNFELFFKLVTQSCGSGKNSFYFSQLRPVQKIKGVDGPVRKPVRWVPQLGSSQAEAPMLRLRWGA